MFVCMYIYIRCLTFERCIYKLKTGVTTSAGRMIGKVLGLFSVYALENHGKPWENGKIIGKP